MKGPLNIICSHCGGENAVCTENINCYACGKGMVFPETIRSELKERFPEGVSYDKEENEFEIEVFKSLNLSEVDRKYISITEDTVYFTFPLKIELGLSVGGSKLKLYKKTLIDFYDTIRQSFENLLNEGGFINVILLTFSTDEEPKIMKEFQFYKDINSTAEALVAVKWILDFKKRLGF